jgi:hypothetical protein
MIRWVKIKENKKKAFLKCGLNSFAHQRCNVRKAAYL